MYYYFFLLLIFSCDKILYLYSITWQIPKINSEFKDNSLGKCEIWATVYSSVSTLKGLNFPDGKGQRWGWCAGEFAFFSQEDK